MPKTSVDVHPLLVTAAKLTQTRVPTATHCLVCLNYFTIQLPVMHQKLGKICAYMCAYMCMYAYVCMHTPEAHFINAYVCVCVCACIHVLVMCV